MQKIITEVLKLSGKSEAAKWASVESCNQIIGIMAELQDNLATFDPSGLAQVAQHLAQAGRHSDGIWSEIDKATVTQLDNFSGEELIKITQAFMTTDYEVSEDLDEKLMDGINEWFESQISISKQDNPYFVTDLQKQYQLAINIPQSSEQLQIHNDGQSDHVTTFTGIVMGEKRQAQQPTTAQMDQIEKVNQYVQQIQGSNSNVKDLMGLK